jgi:hypothetical protein
MDEMAVTSCGRVVRVVEKPNASPSGVSTLRGLPCRRETRHVFPAAHPPELDRSASWEPKEQEKHSIAARQAGLRLGSSTKCPVDSFERIDVRSAFHCDCGKRVKVKSSSPASSELAITGGHRSFHLRENAARAFSIAAASSPWIMRR